jgi:hydrogenase expression/formation protein HypC
MCLAIPGKVLEIYDENDLKMGKVDFSGSVSTTCLAYVPEVNVGEYVIVHAGFAIQVLNEQEAEDVFEAWDELTDTMREQGHTIENEPLSKRKKNLN